MKIINGSSIILFAVLVTVFSWFLYQCLTGIVEAPSQQMTFPNETAHQTAK